MILAFSSWYLLWKNATIALLFFWINIDLHRSTRTVSHFRNREIYANLHQITIPYKFNSCQSSALYLLPALHNMISAMLAAVHPPIASSLSHLRIFPKLALELTISLTFDVVESALTKYVVPAFDNYVAPAFDEYVVPALDDCVGAALDKVVIPALSSNVTSTLLNALYLAIDAYVLPVLGEVVVSAIVMIDDASMAYPYLGSLLGPSKSVSSSKPIIEVTKEVVPFSEVSRFVW